MSLGWADVQDAPSRPELWLRLTRVCNERCLFCYDESAMDGSVVPVGVLHRQLREGRGRGLSEVNFTGGEPTLHPHFDKIARLAKLLGYAKIHVTTNGRRFKDRAFLDAAMAAGLGSATFSVHGHTAELNDALTRAHGSFEDSIAGLRNAVQAGLAVGIHVVVGRQNAPYAAEILRYFEGLGVERVHFIGLVPVSAAWDHRRELFPTAADGWSQLWELFERSNEAELRSLAPALLASHAEYLASTARVPGYAGMFARLLRSGEAQPCRGERCACCPLDGYCRDLERLRETGRLEARPASPACDGGSAGPGAAALELAGATVASFSSFFIEHRLRARGRGCPDCRESARCPGAPVARVAARGFPSPLAEAAR
jgi:MoaA/NifB/PqqE/SkfB family radical SAM enzyme